MAADPHRAARRRRGVLGSARATHLDGFPAAELAEAQATDASIGIQAPANTRALAHVDAERMARAARARAPVREAALARRWWEGR